MSYNELKQRGTDDFPIEYYLVDDADPRYEMSAHWHNEFEIIRVKKGILRIRLNDRIYSAGPGDMIFVNSETVHSAVPEDCEYECTVFHMEFLNVDNLSCKFFVESIINHEYVINEFCDKKNTSLGLAVDFLFEVLKKESFGQQILAIGAFYRIIGTIMDENLYMPAAGMTDILKNKNIAKLKKVLTFIRQNYDKQLTLDEISHSVGMSAKYFCKFFKEMTGKTPFGYLTDYRIAKASRRLLSTDLSITEIAYSAGFNDLSYFIKTFKKQKGISPAKFRKG